MIITSLAPQPHPEDYLRSFDGWLKYLNEATDLEFHWQLTKYGRTTWDEDTKWSVEVFVYTRPPGHRLIHLLCENSSRSLVPSLLMAADNLRSDEVLNQTLMGYRSFYAYLAVHI